MNKKKQRQVDRAVKAMMNMGPVDADIDPSFTKEDLDRKFRMRVDRRGRAKMVEVPAMGGGGETK